MPGTPIQVTAGRQPSDAGIQALAWEIKRDGVSQQTGTSCTFSYTPTVPGTYTVNLTATDLQDTVRTAPAVSVNVWPAPSSPPRCW
jgi:PKD repeat protein